ncbi:hypothetical protein TNCV_913061 [Trichonephila clavipes]|nr:hypothetical protein TNCV_913061 [Trichonephila clavipes]
MSNIRSIHRALLISAPLFRTVVTSSIATTGFRHLLRFTTCACFLSTCACFPSTCACFPVPVKLSTYDEKTNWEVGKTQFSIISEANGWTEGFKVCQLAASLREAWHIGCSRYADGCSLAAEFLRLMHALPKIGQKIFNNRQTTPKVDRGKTEIHLEGQV